MDQNSKILLTLDNIDTIRRFINDRDNVTKSALEQTVDNRIDAVTQHINAAKETLENNYNAQIQLLNEQLNTVSSDNEAAKQEIMEQMAVLESNNADKQTALDKLADDLRKIESEVGSITTDLNVNGLFTREQIKEIADTALIESTTFTDDMVSAPNVVTQQLVALIGHFGQIKASNIVGSEIEGHTIKSSTTIDDEENQFNGQSAWSLYNDGSGYLAKGNINWDADGKVNLTDEVSLNWSQVTGGQDAIDAVQANVDAANNAAAEAQSTAEAAATAASNAQTAADNAYTFAESNILSGDDINQLIAAAEINGTQITKNSISTEQIAANAITANEILAGSITANELNADALLGKVVGSSDLAPGKDYRRWQINSDGSGWVANKKITWTKDGKITCELDDNDTLFCPSGLKLAEGITVSADAVGSWNGVSNNFTSISRNAGIGLINNEENEYDVSKNFSIEGIDIIEGNKILDYDKYYSNFSSSFGTNKPVNKLIIRVKSDNGQKTSLYGTCNCKLLPTIEIDNTTYNIESSTIKRDGIIVTDFEKDNGVILTARFNDPAVMNYVIVYKNGNTYKTITGNFMFIIK